MPRSGSAFRVGLVILAAVAVLGAGVFLIGEKNNFFSHKNKYYIQFGAVSGLKTGSPVQLNGVDVGTVAKVVLPQNPAEESIQVWISVDDQYSARIRGPQDAALAGPNASRTAAGASQARIKTLGLLGDKYIDLTIGAPGFPEIPNEGEIPAAQPTNVDALLASGEDVMDNVVEISASLSTILGRMERGEGLLGELTSDSQSGQRLKESLIGTSESMRRIADKIENGQGPLGRLLNDKAMADKLSASLDRLDQVIASVQSGPGLAPALINDPQMKTSVQDTLAQLNQVARDLHGFTADLETSDALLPRLVNDEEYGREVTGKLQHVVDQLDEVSQKLSRGDGTVAKLLNDPQIYDAVNDIIIGVNESRILRWLIRNRQKKGIERRYDDTRKEMQEEGRTPPPLDAGPDTTETPPPPVPEATPEPTPTPEATPPPPAS
ncbi:MAG TPA: MlaD family protein [Thermoanaerobaculia bacterium]|jgi:phospholipid/cholesterol/gamma-HCH transport system substrate-binding protein|nr:MlaD family protein [Thermoanaerobaculia bacterium]